jgi:hypothetical protein
MKSDHATHAPVQKPIAAAKHASPQGAEPSQKKRKKARKAVTPPVQDDLDSILATLLTSDAPDVPDAPDASDDHGVLTDLNGLHGYDFAGVDFELDQNNNEQAIDSFFAPVQA